MLSDALYEPSEKSTRIATNLVTPGAVLLLLGTLVSAAVAQDDHGFQLKRVIEVQGRQGVATDGERYYVSGSKALYVYSKEGELLKTNDDPFAGLERPANHLGD